MDEGVDLFGEGEWRRSTFRVPAGAGAKREWAIRISRIARRWLRDVARPGPRHGLQGAREVAEVDAWFREMDRALSRGLPPGRVPKGLRRVRAAWRRVAPRLWRTLARMADLHGGREEILRGVLARSVLWS